MPTDNFKVRLMKREELPLAIDWAAREGWNPGLHDAETFFAADSTGFFVGEVDGEPVSVISAVKYGDDFGFIGLYIVKPEFRGRGYGFRTWKEAMASLVARNVGLDAVVEQQKTYERAGFKKVYTNIRYGMTAQAKGVTVQSECGSPSPFPSPPGEGNTSVVSQEQVTFDEHPPALKKFLPLLGERAGVRENFSLNCIVTAKAANQSVCLSSIPFEEILKYDNALFPASRPEFLKTWINQPQAISLGVRQNGKLAGYGVLRPCRSGYKIGPLFADDKIIAEILFQDLVTRIPGEPIFLDTPEINPDAIALAERHGMKKVFETGRMYTKGAPDLAMNKIFGITTFELG